jgi:hypothetical protein
VVEAAWPDPRSGHRFAAVRDAEDSPPVPLAGGRFAENPFIACRWLKLPGETYGRGPVAKALPDIRTANKVVELILKNASIATTGIWPAEDDGVLNPAAIRLVPGAIIPKAAGSAGLTPLAAPGNFDVSQLVLQDLRARIRAALLADHIAQAEKAAMTATKVMERAASAARLLGATYGRLQAELLTPLIARCLAVLRRRGEFPPLVADGREVRLAYASPLARVQARADAADTILFLEAAAKLGGEAAGDRRLLLMAFRGAGKSTLVGLFCAWQLYRVPDTRILVLAADHALATRMVATVRRILARHPLCGALLPEHGEGSWASDRFTVARPAVLRDASMLAAGIGGNITGARAEMIVCDDVEVAGNCDTPAKRAELRERLMEAEFVLTPGGAILYVGTPHCTDSLYAEGEDAPLAGHRRLVLPLLDAAGRSAWPERFPDDAVAKLQARVGPLAFRRQMLLEPVAEEAARLDPALLIRYAAEPDYREANGRGVLTLMGTRLVSGGGWWDPAFGRPGTGDSSVVAATYADAAGRHYLQRLAYVTHDPGGAEDPATQRCRKGAEIARDLLLPVMRVETNGIGGFLPGLLR